jgi:hypothetical protein
VNEMKKTDDVKEEGVVIFKSSYKVDGKALRDNMSWFKFD